MTDRPSRRTRAPKRLISEISRGERRGSKRSFAALPPAEQRRLINEGSVRLRNRRFTGSNYSMIYMTGCTMRGTNNNFRGDENVIHGDGHSGEGDNNIFYGRNNHCDGVNNQFFDSEGNRLSEPAAQTEPEQQAEEQPVAQQAPRDALGFTQSEQRTIVDSLFRQFRSDPSLSANSGLLDALQRDAAALLGSATPAQNTSAPSQPTADRPMPSAGAEPQSSNWKRCVLDLPGESSPTTIGELQCIVCMENKRDTIYEPCGHTAVCRMCTRTLYDPDKSTPTPSCPQCRTKIEFSRIIY